MELDRVFTTFFSHGKKKRYAAKTAWPVLGELIYRGYEIRRTDAFDLQSEAQRRVFARILDKDPDGAVQFARDTVQGLREGHVPEDMIPEDAAPIDLLVISKAVREDERYVNPDSMSNVIIARKLKELGYEVVSGMKVSWIVVDHKKSPMQVEPYIPGRRFEFEPDWDYYARRLGQTLAYVTEIYGWDERALYMGSTQARLDHDGFAGPAPKAVAVQKTDRKLTLEDFF